MRCKTGVQARVMVSRTAVPGLSLARRMPATTSILKSWRDGVSVGADLDGLEDLYQIRRSGCFCFCLV